MARLVGDSGPSRGLFVQQELCCAARPRQGRFGGYSGPAGVDVHMCTAAGWTAVHVYTPFLLHMQPTRSSHITYIASQNTVTFSRLK